MATISSAGIGSGLDVNSIVSQLVALEKQPIKSLEIKATNVKAQISAFGGVQSQFAALTDVAVKLSDSSAWGARKATSSNTNGASITATGSAVATSFRLDVDQLSGSQSISSAAVSSTSTPGAGTLKIQVGSWNTTGPTFTEGASSEVAVSIAATDTLADIAVKINSAGSGVVASVFNDGTNARLLLQSRTTGEAAGFRVQSAQPALSGLVFDPQGTPGGGMAATGIPVQYGQNAKARINGLALTSSTNTLTDNLPGVTISLLSTTTTGYGTFQSDGVTSAEVKSPITMTISEDVTPAVKNVSDFVAAYNKLATTLASLTRYDAATKTAGLFQGDAAVVGLQGVLRSMAGSASTGASSQRLSDVGLELALDGTLSINTTKLSAAANNGTTLQQLFTTNNGNALTNGFALKFKTLGQGVAASGGAVANKTTALQSSLSRNAMEQSKVNDRATLFETRLRARYSTLDAQMAQLSALNSYVAQQVTLWNKSTS